MKNVTAVKPMDNVLLMGIASAYRLNKEQPDARYTIKVVGGARTLTSFETPDESHYLQFVRQDSFISSDLTLGQVEHFYTHFNLDGILLYAQI
jgi:hypothetical protein